ncbi:MAG: hypothetical protein LQ351_002687 [Letrouitia transgressa]|nr:MAG: hypothetical protein LQ351_002687 [Letrouitia transgressa]
MPASTAINHPSLPLPIYQISEKVERYLLYDVATVTWLRSNHHILGVLIGSLPQFPQQNIFLGLPWELQPEETRLLVENGVAYITNDLRWHINGIQSLKLDELKQYRDSLSKEGLEAARAAENQKQQRRKMLIKKNSKGLSSRDGEDECATTQSPQVEEQEENTLFDASLAPQSSRSSAVPAPVPASASVTKHFDSILPWTFTSTTSHPPLSPPPQPSTSVVPPVKSSAYALFKHLHSHGYFLSPGLRFGCRYLVYPGDPLRFHSHFLASDFEWEEEIDLLDLVGGGRLGTGVKKGWLIGGVEKDKAESNKRNEDIEQEEERINANQKVRTFCLEWGGM